MISFTASCGVVKNSGRRCVIVEGFEGCFRMIESQDETIKMNEKSELPTIGSLSL